MFTRKQYMGKECTHREYYGQFVTPHIVDSVADQIGRDILRYSTDEHLNDIALSRWDNVFLTQDALRMVTKANESGGYSLSDTVCIAKEAARQFIESDVQSIRVNLGSGA